MSNRNRIAGHNWERECKNLLKKFFPDIVTTRSESRNRDNEKIDLMNKNESVSGVLPFEFQCKNTCTKLDYNSLISEMPGRNTPCIFHKYTEKSKSGKFIEKGRFAILPMDEFIKILEKIYEHK